MVKAKIDKKNNPPSAERILTWLEEANQFMRRFLSKESLLKWEQVKNKPLK